MQPDDTDLPNATHEKALRLVRLLELLKLKPWTAQQLATALGVRKRAVLYYLEDLKELEPYLGFRLLHDTVRHTYALNAGVLLSDIDKVVAHTALRMLYHHSPGHNQQYLEAMLKLARGLPEPARTVAQRSAEVMAARGPGLEGSNLEKITNAWFRRQLVQFHYQLPGRREPTKFELETYFIEVSRANMAVYVIGRERSYKNELRTFKLARMQFVTLVGSTEAYEIPASFDPREYLSDAWGIVGGGGNPVRVKLRFLPSAVQRIREGGYPNLRELEQRDDGSLVVEVTVGTDEGGFPIELLSWVQSWGPRVEVLEPEFFRQRWLEEARAVMELYAAAGGGSPSPQRRYWAHTHKDRRRWQTMLEHATEVARLASERAAHFGEEEKANLAGVLHDIGKYGDLFQRRLEGEESGLDHWSAGAHIALFDYRAVDVALAIQGHHIGLQSGAKQSLKEMRLDELAQRHPLELRLTETDLDVLKGRLEADGIALPEPSTRQISLPPSSAAMLDTRMLFSALVDADFLDTERTMNQGDAGFMPRPVAPKLQAARALELLEKHLQELSSDESIPQKTRELRRSLADACAEAADAPARIFTLTAPTGTGKTLSMLRFALRRAVHDPKVRRVVVVLPFLSILDQVVDVYHGLFAEFGEHYILEHHSLTGIREGPGKDGQALLDRQRRLLSENWDAPIIITTSVQFLESLHANRPSACRKLHNLAGSIILLDEVQTLPVKLAVPTLKTLSRLASDKYGCTVVFATATQPAFDSLHPKVQQGELPTSGWQPHEVVTRQAELFQQAKRVRILWRTQTPTPWSELVETLKEQSQALCIVNLKRHAYALTQGALQQGLEGVYHLSTALCPQHRRDLLEQITRDLKARKPCRVFATQCVEAGVDLDFPIVYRALAPLDAIAQAAGRCNRHDSLPEKGTLTVFMPEEEKYPTKAYRQAAELTRSLLMEHGGLDLDDPETYRCFYRSLYNIANTTDPELDEFIKTQNYGEFARRYRLIDTNAVNVVVPYNDEARALMQEARDQGITGEWMRRVRGYVVPLFLEKNRFPPYLETVFPRFGRKDQEVPDWFLCAEEDPFTYQSYYHPMFGLLPEEGGL